MQKIKIEGGQHAGLPNCFHFNEDYLVIGTSGPGLVRIWNIKTGNQVRFLLFILHAYLATINLFLLLD